MNSTSKTNCNSEKFYTFDLFDHINVNLNMCNHNESFKNLGDAYLLHSVITGDVNHGQCKVDLEDLEGIKKNEN